MIRKTLLEIIAVNREEILLSSTFSLNILALLHKNFDDVEHPDCVLSLALNDSLARMLFHADHDTAISISRAVIARFPEAGDSYFVARHLAVIGRCLALSGRYFEAAIELNKALAIGEKLEKCDETHRHVADVLHDLAMNNDMSGGDHDTSVDYLERAIQVLSNIPFEVRKGVYLMGLGNIKYNNGKVQSALEYYLMASLIFDEHNNFANLASVDSNIGNCYTDLDIPALAENYLLRSLNLRQKIGNKDEIAISYFNLGRLYEHMQDLRKAVMHMKMCMDCASGSINKKIYYMAQEALDTLAERQGVAMDAVRR